MPTELSRRRDELVWAAKRVCSCLNGGCNKCLSALRAALHNLHIEEQKTSRRKRRAS
jgi:hypothetical protein